MSRAGNTPGEDDAAAAARRDAREPRESRESENAEDRFYTRPDPNVAAPSPPDPGTTPAELEETDAAGLAPDPAPPRRP